MGGTDDGDILGPVTNPPNNVNPDPCNVAPGPLIGERVAEFHDLVSERIATRKSTKAPRVTRNPYLGDRSGITGAHSRE